MIQGQIPSHSHYRRPRTKFYSICSEGAKVPIDSASLALTNPQTALQFINKSVQRLAAHHLIGGRYVRQYLMSQYRRNRSINTLRTNFCALYQFFRFLKLLDRRRFEDIRCDDLSAYIEHEQDQGKKPLTVHGRLRSLKGFFNYHIDLGNVDPAILKRRLHIKLPQRLPRAIDPDDIRRLLTVIAKTRDQALILTLLRTGMRIGELLSTRLSEVNLPERRIEIYQAHKNLAGRVVYLSTDAHRALAKWIKLRDVATPYLFYGHKGTALCYEAARAMFNKYLMQAELSHKGYTLHCLRHTFASELLNAGMRLECLQQLLGHSDIEMTRLYARLTDVTRRDEYFKAMAIIEKGELNGHYRCDCPLS